MVLYMFGWGSTLTLYADGKAGGRLSTVSIGLTRLPNPAHLQQHVL
jgi:hypothetical protein